MTYVKNGALIYSVDDSEVPKYLDRGFSVYSPNVQRDISNSETEQADKKPPEASETGGKNGKDKQ